MSSASVQYDYVWRTYGLRDDSSANRSVVTRTYPGRSTRQCERFTNTVPISINTDRIAKVGGYRSSKTREWIPLGRVDVERSFSVCKHLLTDRRRGFAEENLQYHFVIDFDDKQQKGIFVSTRTEMRTCLISNKECLNVLRIHRVHVTSSYDYYYYFSGTHYS